MNTYESELVVIDKRTGQIDEVVTQVYNEYLTEDVEGLNLEVHYIVGLRKEFRNKIFK